LLICIDYIVIVCIAQSGISDAESHSNALKILLQMGEFFQIQVTTNKCLQYLPIYCFVILLHVQHYGEIH